MPQIKTWDSKKNLIIKDFDKLIIRLKKLKPTKLIFIFEIYKQ